MATKRQAERSSSEKQAVEALQEYREILKGRRGAIQAAINELCCSGKYLISQSTFDRLKADGDKTRLLQIMPIAGAPHLYFYLPEKEDEASKFIRLLVELMNTFSNSEDVLAKALGTDIPPHFILKIFAAGVLDGRDGLLLSEFQKNCDKRKGGRATQKLTKSEHYALVRQALNNNRGRKSLAQKSAEELFNSHGIKVTAKTFRKWATKWGLWENT